MRDTDFKALLLLMSPQLIKREMKLEALDLLSAARKVYASQEFERIEQGKLQPFMELVSREEAVSIGRREEIYLYALEVYRQEKLLTGRTLERLLTEKEAWEVILTSPELPRMLSPGRILRSMDAILDTINY